MASSVLRAVVLGPLQPPPGALPSGVEWAAHLPGAPVPSADVYLLPFRGGKEAWEGVRALHEAGIVDAPRALEGPLILLWALGPAANPAPFEPFADATLLGGGAARLAASLDTLRQASGLPRPARLDRLAASGGVALAEGQERVTAWAPEAVPGAEPLRALPTSEGRALAPDGVLEIEPAHPDPAVQTALGVALTPDEVGALVAEAAGGLRRLVLRFWIGLGPDEARALTAWCRQCRHEAVARLRDERRCPPVTVSVACFVPRPWTPFQWLGMARLETLVATLGRLRQEFRGLGWATLTADLPKWARIEALLARGDRRVAEVVRLALRDGDWERAETESPWNPAWFVHRPRPRDEAFPWDRLDWGVDREALWRRYEAFCAARGRPG